MSDYEIISFANQLRENVGLKRDDIVGSIVDLVQNAGYQFMEDSFGNEFSGFSKSLGNFNYLIGFNKDHYWSEKFRRFTVSHELGHISIPKHRKILDKEILHRSVSEYMSKEEIEREADKFAINFLAPRDHFQKIIATKNFSKEVICELSDHFQISSYATALRFVELTDLTCALIVCTNKGRIKYEKRSKRMSDSFKHGFLYEQEISCNTLTYDFIKHQVEDDEKERQLLLNEWYYELPNEVECAESVMELGYNGIYLALVTPNIADFDECFSQND